MSPDLSTTVVEVWRVPLDPPGLALDRRLSALSVAERERAGRFFFAHDRRRALAARAGLRAVLAAVTGEAPQAIRLGADRNGKPRLLNGGPAFNLSHDRDLALVAVSVAGDVGVDLESVDPRLALDEVAPVSLTIHEQAWLQGLPPRRRPRAFTACWVAKEAYLKAVGEGLRRPPHEVEVLAAETRPVVRALDEPSPAIIVRRVPAGTGRVAAVACTAARFGLRLAELVW